ncbi:uncharacterized protein [Procambarus clarkii]|uniref:uncharacterized protein isoform X1 n=1 Tax=Procambarus clarkii TaxID=6728 RepID=UPI0037429D0D
MVVFFSGKASGFKNVHDHDTYDVDGTRLFRVRGTCDFDTRAVQVPEVAGSLNADDAFVLETPGKTCLWIGKGASEEEKAMGEKVAELVSPGRDLQYILLRLGAGRPSGQHAGLVILWSWVRSQAPVRNNGQSFFHPMPLLPSSKIGTWVLVSCHGLLPGGGGLVEDRAAGTLKAPKSSQDNLKITLKTPTILFVKLYK